MGDLVLAENNELNMLFGRVFAHLTEQHKAKGDRSLTARNYESSINAYRIWAERTGNTTPSRIILDRWKRDMLDEGYAVKTVNARLSAMRKLLVEVANETTDIQAKLVLKDWATVPDAKAVKDQDRTDYGERLPLPTVRAMYKAFPRDRLGLRSRAEFALMVGAGLRVSEVANLTIEDVFHTKNEKGQKGIRIRQGKHNKSRVSVIGNQNRWVLDAVDDWCESEGITSGKIFRVTSRTIQNDMQRVGVKAHDLRRTYAYHSKKSGMSWEALRENMGHSSIKTTEDYVGRDVDWADREPEWSILDG